MSSCRTHTGLSTRRTLRPIGLLIAAALCLPAVESGAAYYIRDEIRVNMRAGPGLQYKIVELLTSGNEVEQLTRTEEWVKVRSTTGEEGWVPTGYVTEEPPASVGLPAAQAKLTQATARIEELETKLTAAEASVTDLAELREKNEALTQEVDELTWSSGWKSLATGAAIIIMGMVIGLLIPRGSSARNRIKL